MKRLFAIILILSTFVLSGLSADTLEFNMPDLAGGSADSTKIDSFVYHGQSANVNGVTVRFVGHVYSPGLIHCLTPPTEPDTFTWYLDVDSAIRKNGGGAAWQIGDYWLSQAGPFDDTKKHYNGFSTLSDGDVVETELHFAWNEDWQMAPDPCWLIETGYGEMYTVTVILDVSYGTPVKPSTWGRIKNLYE